MVILISLSGTMYSFLHAGFSPLAILVFCMPSRLYLFVVRFKLGWSFSCKIHWVDGGQSMRSLTPSCGGTGGFVAAALPVLLQMSVCRLDMLTSLCSHTFL